MSLYDELASRIKGDVQEDEKTLSLYSHDTSIFERRPKVVIFPKNTEDVIAVVRFVREKKERGENVSIAPRSAGTDMTGGPLTDSIVLSFIRHMNAIIEMGGNYVITEPGAYYRDLEKRTLAERGMLIPSYPASRELCAIGGMIANNSGGELTLQYGKTNRYIRELEVVLSDGSRAILKPLSVQELGAKKAQTNFEGEIYRRIHALLQEHAAEIEAARPSVSKNSAGYAMWDIWDRQRGIFDLTQLIAGSQGTLAIITRAKLGLVRLRQYRAMLVIFLSDLSILPEIIKRILALRPESFESYDDQTFRLAVRFIPQIIRHLGFAKMVKLGLSFLPEVFLIARGGVPKLVLMAEFAEDSAEEALALAHEAEREVQHLPVRTKIAKSETAVAKYWTIRRESFSLLRKNLRGLHAAPFIDDLVVHPNDCPKFLPELQNLLSEYPLTYTIAGHIGDADFHIIPLMNLSRAADRREILELTPRVYKLVAKYRGSITGEHNDGLIRTPYLPLMYGEKVCALFAEVKKIFDPLNILNPGKKVPLPQTGGTISDIERFMIKP